jgi:hypothetical protein
MPPHFSAAFIIHSALSSHLKPYDSSSTVTFPSLSIPRMSADHIQLKSIRDLDCLAEVFREVTFQCTIFTYFDQHGVAYFGELLTRKKQISLQVFQENLKPIPDEDIYPLCRRTLPLRKFHPVMTFTLNDLNYPPTGI